MFAPAKQIATSSSSCSYPHRLPPAARRPRPDGLLQPGGGEHGADGVTCADGQRALEVDVREDPTSGPVVEQSSAALHHEPILHHRVAIHPIFGASMW